MSQDALVLAAGSVVLLVKNDQLHRLINPKASSSGDSKVLTMAVSPDDELVLAAYSDKTVVCWDTSNKRVVATGTLAKRACGMACGLVEANQVGKQQGKYILSVVDKQGEIHCANAVKLDSWVPMGGHTSSVITDMQIILEGSLLATADRDEKIRISRFPELFHISGYCMGHTSVVSTLCEATTSSSRRLLVSGGWEHKLCVWDATEGKLVSSTNTRSSKGEEKPKEGGEKDSFPEEGGDEKSEEEEEEEAEKTYDAKAAGEFPSKVRSTRIEGQDGDLVLVSFNESPALNVYTLSSEGELVLETSYEAPAPVVDFACLSTGRIVVLLPGSHQLQVLGLTASTTIKIAPVEQTSKAFLDLMEACETLQVDFSQQQYSMESGGEGQHSGGGAIREKHVIKRSFHAMIRGEPGTLERKDKGAKAKK